THHCSFRRSNVGRLCVWQVAPISRVVPVRMSVTTAEAANRVCFARAPAPPGPDGFPVASPGIGDESRIGGVVLASTVVRIEVRPNGFGSPVQTPLLSGPGHHLDAARGAGGAGLARPR